MFFIRSNSIIFAILAYATVGTSDERSNLERIMGGTNAKIIDYPYQVGIKGPSTSIFCGGTILSPHIIVTAAHCTFGKRNDELLIVAGTSRIDVQGEDDGGIIRNVSKIIVHEGYHNQDPPDWDVSLIVLSEDLIFSNKIAPIELASEDLDDNVMGVATGWGLMEPTSNPATILQAIKIPTLNQSLCKKLYRRANLNITERMVCVGNVGFVSKGVCRGDSGGPFVREGLLYGITSWGKDCISKFFPGVFARVPYYRDWIMAKMIEIDEITQMTNRFLEDELYYSSPLNQLYF